MPAPTNASSSTITGRAPAGSSTPPIVTPAARWTRSPICAHDPTRTCESTIVPAPTHAPTLTYDGGITTTPGAEVGAGPDRRPAGHDPRGPARDRSGGSAARSWNANGPTVHESRSSGRAKRGEDRGLHLGSDPPAIGCGRVGLGRAERAGGERREQLGRERVDARSPAASPTAARRPRSPRPLTPAPRCGSASGRRPPRPGPRPRSVGQPSARGASASGRSGAAHGVGLEETHQREGGLDRHGVRAADEVRAGTAAASARGSGARRPSRRPAPRRTARPARPGSRCSPPRRRRRRPARASAASRHRRRRGPRRRAADRGRSAAICSRLPLASLIAMTRGCSARRRNTSAGTFVPVRDGTL